MATHLGPLLRAVAHNRRDYRVLVFATAVGFTVVVHALAFASIFRRALSFNAGFDDAHMVVVGIEGDGSPAAAEAAMRRVPQVEEVAWVTRRPFHFNEMGEPVAPIDAPDESVLAWPICGDERLARALGAPLLAGRMYVDELSEGGDIEAVVSQSLAFAVTGKGPQEAIGSRFLNGVSNRIMRIVGVVPDLAVQMSYVPTPTHALFTYAPVVEARRYYAILHVTSDDADTLQSIRDSVRANGQWIEADSVTALRRAINATNRGAKTILIVVVGTVLFVGLIGTFGVSSFSVAERARQIGIRRALGATRNDIIKYFLDENLLVTTAGIVAGLPLTLAVNAIAARLLPDFLLEWQHLVVSAVLFYVTGLIAAHAPALRAARIEPSVASRAA